MKTVLATIRQVIWPYDVFKRTETGAISTRSGEPVPAPVASWTAKVLSLITFIVTAAQIVQEVLERWPQ